MAGRWGRWGRWRAKGNSVGSGVGGAVRLWLRSYLLLDVAGTLFSLLFGCATYSVTERIGPMVVAAVVGENVGFYGAALLREWRRGAGHGDSRRASVLNVLQEFMPAECLDVAVIRPAALVFASSVIDSPAAAIVMGGLIADLSYYTVAARCAPVRPSVAEPALEPLTEAGACAGTSAAGGQASEIRLEGVDICPSQPRLSLGVRGDQIAGGPVVQELLDAPDGALRLRAEGLENVRIVDEKLGRLGLVDRLAAEDPRALQGAATDHHERAAGL